MNETINTIASEATAEVINNASEVVIEASDAVIHVAAKSNIITRIVSSTAGKCAVGAVAVAAVSAAGYYGWKKYQNYKAGKQAEAFCKKAQDEVKKAAEQAVE